MPPSASSSSNPPVRILQLSIRTGRTSSSTDGGALPRAATAEEELARELEATAEEEVDEEPRAATAVSSEQCGLRAEELRAMRLARQRWEEEDRRRREEDQRRKKADAMTLLENHRRLKEEEGRIQATMLEKQPWMD